MNMVIFVIYIEVYIRLLEIFSGQAQTHKYYKL